MLWLIVRGLFGQSFVNLCARLKSAGEETGEGENRVYPVNLLLGPGQRMIHSECLKGFALPGHRLFFHLFVAGVTGSTEMIN